jgi:hypothetical protein
MIETLDWENLAKENLRLEMNDFKREIERQELIIKQQQQDLKAKNNVIDCLDTVMHVMQEDVASKVRDSQKHACYRVIKKNAQPNDPYPYLTVRAQKRNLSHAMNKVKAKYPKYTTLLDIPYTPNAMNLQVRVKEELTPMLTFKYNNMASNFETEGQLIEGIKGVAGMIM